MSADRPTDQQLSAAYRRVRPYAVTTPLLESRSINQRLGARLLFKAEPLQVTGSFKFRGAINSILQAKQRGSCRHVVAYSSGNHAQGVAAAAQLLGVAATIVMPADAPAIKLDNTRSWGAEVRAYDRSGQSREQIATELAKQLDAPLIKPYDAIDTICGQASTGLEMVEQCQVLGVTPARALICCGGGGLTAGVALALRSAFPDIKIYAVEPAGFDEHLSVTGDGRAGQQPSARQKPLRRPVGASAGRAHLRHQQNSFWRAAWWSMTVKSWTPWCWPFAISNWW